MLRSRRNRVVFPPEAPGEGPFCLLTFQGSKRPWAGGRIRPISAPILTRFFCVSLRSCLW